MRGDMLVSCGEIHEDGHWASTATQVGYDRSGYERWEVHAIDQSLGVVGTGDPTVEVTLQRSYKSPQWNVEITWTSTGTSDRSVCNADAMVAALNRAKSIASRLTIMASILNGDDPDTTPSDIGLIGQ